MNIGDRKPTPQLGITTNPETAIAFLTELSKVLEPTIEAITRSFEMRIEPEVVSTLVIRAITSFAPASELYQKEPRLRSYLKRDWTALSPTTRLYLIVIAETARALAGVIQCENPGLLTDIPLEPKEEPS